MGVESRGKVEGLCTGALPPFQRGLKFHSHFKEQRFASWAGFLVFFLSDPPKLIKKV